MQMNGMAGCLGPGELQAPCEGGWGNHKQVTFIFPMCICTTDDKILLEEDK